MDNRLFRWLARGESMTRILTVLHGGHCRRVRRVGAGRCRSSTPVDTARDRATIDTSVRTSRPRSERATPTACTRTLPPTSLPCRRTDRRRSGTRSRVVAPVSRGLHRGGPVQERRDRRQRRLGLRPRDGDGDHDAEGRRRGDDGDRQVSLGLPASDGAWKQARLIWNSNGAPPAATPPPKPSN